MKILVAIDGSSQSQALTSLVNALGLGAKAEMILVTVIPDHIFLGGHSLAGIARRSGEAASKLLQAQESSALRLLSPPANALAATGYKVESSVRRGNPAQEIIMACHDTQADLVAVGTRGVGDASDSPLGSVAHKVARYAPCSVLVVKKEVPAIGRVLLPLDGSRYGEEAVSFLLGMPLPTTTEVLLTAVVQSCAEAFLKSPTLDIEADREIFATLQKAEEEAAHMLMAGAANDFRKRGYKVTTIIGRADPSSEILREAAARGVDLIALGAKGLTGVRSFLIGSVALRVARHAKCAVLIVRPPDRRRSEPTTRLP